MIYRVRCSPIWSPYRRKPVYVVSKITRVDMPCMRKVDVQFAIKPTAKIVGGVKSLYVPVDRYIRPGAIINPTRELRRVLS
jgi:hypothetical protein